MFLHNIMHIQFILGVTCTRNNGPSGHLYKAYFVQCGTVSAVCPCM